MTGPALTDEQREELDKAVGIWMNDPDSDVIGETVAHMIADAERRALLEAANAWRWSEWSNVLLPKPTPPAVPVIAYANRFGDWLQERAGDDR